jgi:hypothetical protein
VQESLRYAFNKNTRPWHSIFSDRPVGWGRRARKRLARVTEAADTYIQSLNDRFAKPSGPDGPATAVVEGGVPVEVPREGQGTDV